MEKKKKKKEKEKEKEKENKLGSVRAGSGGLSNLANRQ